MGLRWQRVPDSRISCLCKLKKMSFWTKNVRLGDQICCPRAARVRSRPNLCLQTSMTSKRYAKKNLRKRSNVARPRVVSMVFFYFHVIDRCPSLHTPSPDGLSPLRFVKHYSLDKNTVRKDREQAYFQPEECASVSSFSIDSYVPISPEHRVEEIK